MDITENVSIAQYTFKIYRQFSTVCLGWSHVYKPRVLNQIIKRTHNLTRQTGRCCLCIIMMNKYLYTTIPFVFMACIV